MKTSVGRWGLALAAAVASLLLVLPAAHADVPVSATATRRFEEGVRYLRSRDADRYEKAYREFKAAYADSPSWKILGNLGIVAQELERDGEAIDAYRGYLDGGGSEISAEDRKQFESDLALLESGLVTVTVRSEPEGAWIVDERLPEAGRPVINRYGPARGELVLRVRAGHHRMRAELAQHADETWEFSETAGGTAAHVFELRRNDGPVESSSAPPVVANGSVEPADGGAALEITGYTALGLGVVGIGVGTWFLFDIDDKEGDYAAQHNACARESDPPDACNVDSPGYNAAIEARDAEGRTRTTSLIGFIAGGALVTTGVVLLILASGDDDPAPTLRDQATLTPWIGPRSLGLSGTF